MELPFKLLVSVMILAIVTPVFATGYRNAARTKLVESVRSDIDDILYLSRSLIYQGNLSRSEISIDLEGCSFASVAYIRFGDSLGNDSRLIEYKMDWWDNPRYVYTSDPVRLTSRMNTTFVLNEGVNDIALTRLTVKNETFIVFSPSDQSVVPENFV